MENDDDEPYVDALLPRDLRLLKQSFHGSTRKFVMGPVGGSRTTCCLWVLFNGLAALAHGMFLAVAYEQG